MERESFVAKGSVPIAVVCACLMGAVLSCAEKKHYVHVDSPDEVPSAERDSGDVPKLSVMRGHSGPIKAVAISKDSRFAATAGEDKTVIVWDVEQGAQIGSFTVRWPAGHVSITPDNRYVYAIDVFFQYKWDILESKLVQSKMFHPGGPTTMLPYSSDGEFVIAHEDDEKNSVINLIDGTVSTMHTSDMDIDSFDVSKKNSEVYFGTKDGKIWIFDLTTGKRKGNFQAHEKLYGVRRVCNVLGDNHLISISTGKCILWKRHDKGNYAVDTDLEVRSPRLAALTSDGKYINIITEESLLVWDVAQRDWVRNLVVAADLFDVAFSADGNKVIWTPGGASHEVFCGNIGTEKITKLSGIDSAVMAVDIAKEGNLLAYGGTDEVARLYDLEHCRVVRSFIGEKSKISFLCFSPDSKFFAAGYANGAIVAWNLANEEKVFSKKGHDLPISWLRFSNDGSKLFSAACFEKSDSMDCVKAWSFATSELLTAYKMHKSGTRFMTLSNRGEMIAASYGDDESEIFLVSDGKILQSFSRKYGYRTLGFTPDDTGFIRCSGGFEFRRIDNGKEFKTLTDGEDNFSVSSDGKLIAMYSDDVLEAFPKLTVVEMETGKVISSSRASQRFVGNPIWTPDCSFLVQVGLDGALHVFDAKSGAKLCGFISIGDEWAVTTPAGLFDASKNAMTRISWAYKGQSYSLKSFYEEYYSPDLMTTILSREEISNQPTTDISAGFGVPPEVSITSPAGQLLAERQEIEVAVQAVDRGGGIDEIRLYHNGKIVSADTKGILVKPKEGVQTKTFAIILTDGDNFFRATGFSKDRVESAASEITIKYKASGISRKPTLHIVSVGINSYKNSDLDLNFAINDSKGVVDQLKKNAETLFESVQVTTLHDAMATRANILASFESLTNCSKEDVAVIFLSGHGEMVESSWYFVPYELVHPERESDILQIGVSSTDIKNLLTKMNPQKVLLIIDACKSGGAITALRTKGLVVRKGLSELARISARLSNAVGVHILAASTKDQVATELGALGNGVFTYTLLDALKGNGDYDKNGVISIRELMLHVENQVPAYSEKYKTERQYPVADMHGMDFPISVVE